MTGAWRLKNHVIPKPALLQVRELRFTQKISFKKFPLYVRDDRCMAFKKGCHPETCLSAGEGPSLKPHSTKVLTDRIFHRFQKLIFYYNRRVVVQYYPKVVGFS
jgi:hypothetical protein